MRPHQLTPVLHLLYIGTLPFTLSCGAFKQSSAVPPQREGKESSLPFARSEGACSFPPPMLLLAVTEEGEGAPLASCCFVSFRFVFRVFASTGELERRSSSMSGGLQWLDARPMRGGGGRRARQCLVKQKRESKGEQLKARLAKGLSTALFSFLPAETAAARPQRRTSERSGSFRGRGERGERAAKSVGGVPALLESERQS